MPRERTTYDSKARATRRPDLELEQEPELEAELERERIRPPRNDDQRHQDLAAKLDEEWRFPD